MIDTIVERRRQDLIDGIVGDGVSDWILDDIVGILATYTYEAQQEALRAIKQLLDTHNAEKNLGGHFGKA